MTGNKIILVNTYVFFFITALFLYSIGKIKFKKLILISLAFFFFILLIFSIYQVNRTKCLNYLNASNITNQDLSLNKSIYNSQSEFNRNYIYIKDSNYFNSFFRKLVNDNVSLNYSLFYILAGKLSGDYLHDLDLKDKINLGHFVYTKQIYNKFISHLNKLEIVRFEYIKYDNNFLQRKNPVVSLYHSLFRDFGYFNLVFLYTLFLFFFLILLNKINKIKLILYFFWFYIIFYETMTLGFVNLLATYNSIIIFIIFLFFLIFFISISKIKIKYK